MIKDILNQKFNRLTVISFSEIRKDRKAYWNCVCDCGNVSIVSGKDLRSGNTKSCGCLNIDAIKERSTTHGLSDKIPEYNTWMHMRARCSNHNNKRYDRYGGRGITICDSWLNSFESFLNDMGRKPGPEYSIERIDNDKGYEKSNCKWGTPLEQALNRRSTVWVEFDGKIMSRTQAAKELNISYKVARRLFN